ncbi:hypothetical protein [Streptomyces sp. NPDC047070]|uniref:hypothetical protein n=1 Tax=Streptomyces sp. NPDC047070 TaxID=3154923 RepID=UPI00345142F2
MNPVEHQDDRPRERVTLSAEQKQEGFAAVMERLKKRSDEDRARLLEQANTAVRGYAAYRVGEKYQQLGQDAFAVPWLMVAARLRIPGAAEALSGAQQRAPGHRPFSPQSLKRYEDRAEEELAAFPDYDVPPAQSAVPPPPPRRRAELPLPPPRSGSRPQNARRAGASKGFRDRRW